jgi:hypothetical protein
MRQKVLYAGLWIGALTLLVVQLIGHILILARFVGH